MLITTPVLAVDLYLSTGAVYMGRDENYASTYQPVVTLLVEQSVKDYPWFISITTVDEYYLRQKVFISKHYTVQAGKRIGKWNYSDDTFFYFDFGLAAISERSYANSSYITFYESLGVSFHDYRLGLTHTSNAGLNQPNHGETTVVFQYKLDF